MNTQNPNRQRGAALIQVAVALVVLIAFVGLAIDAGRAYLVKTKLSAAVDGAAIAAGQAVVHGANETEQRASADRAARAVFAANFANDTLGVNALTLDPPDIQFSSLVSTPPRRHTSVGVSAKAQLPVTFMSILGFHNLDIPTRAEVVRNDIDLLLIVDSSQSMSFTDYSVTPTRTFFATAKRNAADFTLNLNPRSDRVGHFVFNSSFWNIIDFQPSPGFDPAIYNQIDNAPFNIGYTSICRAFIKGREMIQGITSDPAPFQVILLASDGGSNGPCWTSDAREDALRAAEDARLAGIHIYTIAYDTYARPPDDPDYQNLKCFANSPDAPTPCKRPGQPTGRYCFAGNTNAGLSACYNEIASQLLKMTK